MPFAAPFRSSPARLAPLFPTDPSDTPQSDDHNAPYAETPSPPIASASPTLYFHFPPSPLVPFDNLPAQSTPSPLRDSWPHCATCSAPQYQYSQSPPPRCNPVVPPFAQRDKDSPPPNRSSEYDSFSPALDGFLNPSSAKAPRAPSDATSSPAHPSFPEIPCSHSTPSP